MASEYPLDVDQIIRLMRDTRRPVVSLIRLLHNAFPIHEFARPNQEELHARFHQPRR